MDCQKYITLSQAAALLPGRPHLSTLHRWRLGGIRGVRLQTALVGGRRFTTRQWLDEFIAKTTAAADGEPVRSQAPSRLERDAERANRELEATGW